MVIRWKSSRKLRFIFVVIMCTSIIVGSIIGKYLCKNYYDIQVNNFYATYYFQNIINKINSAVLENITLKIKNEEKNREGALTDTEIYSKIQENLNEIKRVPSFKYIVQNNENNKVETNLEDYNRNESGIKKLKEKSTFYIILDSKNNSEFLRNADTSLSKKELEEFYRCYGGFFKDIKEKNLKVSYFVVIEDFVDDELTTSLNGYEYVVSNYKNRIIGEVICIVLFLISVIYLKIFRKNSGENKSFVEELYNKLWIEIKIVIIVIVNILLYCSSSMTIKYGFDEEVFFAFILGIIDYYMLSFSYNALKKAVKEKDYIRNKSLLYKMIIFMKKLFVKRDMGFKIIPFIVATVIFIVLLIMLVAGSYNSSSIFAFTILYFSCYAIFMCFRIGEFEYYLNKILMATLKISNGDMNCEVEEKGRGLLRNLAYNINHIKTGFKEALIKEMKSERMKSELITNVSHDLKTPLTSIINYVDLLKNEELSKEERRDYISILDKKSQRLKVLIEDLFEASKAASGELQLNIEKVDIVALLKQALTEFEEKIKESGLDFKVNLPKEKIYVMVDGKKTWRIFENQITNILKYSLKNTRVYINLKDEEDKVSISMKNISQYELDFSEEEIIERFRRGDKARNTEGSGLGLAISKSLAELQGGNFNINIDGDLFKAMIEFPRYK